jgi:predicted Zn finger-like uncharacterized protein
MKIVCDSCATKYSISDDKVRGKVFKIRCKKCSHIIVVRGTADSSAPAPSVAAPEGGWHLVVDGDQVGPLPEADIRGRLSRGEINAETYVWKEGFADWLKLSSVPEFAELVPASAPAGEVSGVSLTGSGVDFFNDSAPVSSAHSGNEEGGVIHQAAAPARSGGLFGAVDAASSAARGARPVADESDAFAAPAVSRGGGGGDLFSAHAAQASASDEGRRPGGNHDGGRVENLTAQRHENSVLFSLANLQSLAMPSAGSAKAAPASNGSTSSSSEGSGLIDIRAMAATTLGTPSDSRGGAGFGDDLPAFGSFTSAAPVLLPMPSSSGPPKWIYVVIGGMAIALIGIVVMAYKILTVKPITVVQPAPAPLVIPAPLTAPAPPSTPAPAGAAVAPAAPAIADENLPPREGAEAAKPAEPKHGSGKHGKGGKERKGGSASSESGGKSGGASAPVAAAAPEEKKAAKGSLDDLLENALAGKKSRPRPAADDDSPKKGADSSSSSAGPLSKSAVVSGMNSVKPKINDCYSQFKVPGMAMVNVVIGKSGKVSSATVSGKFAGTPTGTCVEKAVKSAGFPPSDGLTTPYPFTLR